MLSDIFELPIAQSFPELAAYYEADHITHRNVMKKTLDEIIINDDVKIWKLYCNYNSVLCKKDQESSSTLQDGVSTYLRRAAKGGSYHIFRYIYRNLKHLNHLVLWLHLCRKNQRSIH